MVQCFPRSSRTLSGEPTKAALLFMTACTCVCLFAVAVFALAGSRCSETVTLQTRNPRVGCARQRALTAAERAVALPVTQVQSPEAPMLIHFDAYEFAKAHPRILCANPLWNTSTGYDVVYSSTTKAYTVLTPLGFTFTFANAVPSIATEMEVLCAGDEFAVLERTKHNSDNIIGQKIFALFVYRARFRLDLDETVLQGHWFSLLNTPTTTGNFSSSFRVSGTTSDFRRLALNESTTILFTNKATKSFASMSSGVATGAAAFADRLAFAGGVLTLDAQDTTAPLADMVRYPNPSSSNYAALFAVELPSTLRNTTAFDPVFLGGFLGDVGLFCHSLACDSMFQRFIISASLALGVYGLCGFVVRVLPPCHEQQRRPRPSAGKDDDDGRRHVQRAATLKDIVPLDAVSFGRRPKACTGALVFSVQLCVAIAAVWFTFARTTCSNTVVEAASNPRRSCEDRALTQDEAKTVFGEALRTDSSGGVLAKSRDTCASGEVATLELKHSFVLENHPVGTAICQLDTQNVTVVVTNGDGGGVTLEWTKPDGSNVTFHSATLSPLYTAPVIACSSNSIAVLEFDEGATRTFLFDLTGNVISRSSVTVSVASAERAWRRWIATKQVSKDVVLPYDSIELLPGTGTDQDIEPVSIVVDGDGNTEIVVIIRWFNSDGETPLGFTAVEDSGVLELMRVDMTVGAVVTPATSSKILSLLTGIPQTLASYSSFAVRAGACPAFAMPMRQGSVNLWCVKESCDALLKRAATASAIAFAILTVLLMLVRVCAPCHKRRATETMGDYFLSIFPAIKSKRVVAVTLGVETALLAVLAFALVTGDRTCSVGYGPRADIATREGCLRKEELTSEETAAVLPFNNSTVGTGTQVMGLLFASNAALLKSGYVTRVVDLLCANKTNNATQDVVLPPPLRVNQYVEAFDFLTPAMWRCAGLAFDERVGASFVYVPQGSVSVRLDDRVLLDELFWPLVGTNATSAVAHVNVSAVQVLQRYVLSVNTAEDAFGSFRLDSQLAPRVSVGESSIPGWSLDVQLSELPPVANGSSIEAWRNFLLVQDFVVVLLSDVDGAPARVEAVQAAFPLLCLTERCDTFTTRASGFAAVFLSASAFVVFVARHVSKQCNDGGEDDDDEEEEEETNNKQVEFAKMDSQTLSQQL